MRFRRSIRIIIVIFFSNIPSFHILPPSNNQPLPDFPCPCRLRSAYADFVRTSFGAHGFAGSVAAAVNRIYAAQLGGSAELAYQVLVADYSFLCGGVVLGIAAARAFRSPVYLSVGTHAPCNPFHVVPGTPPARYAGHNMDLVFAIQSWDYYAVHFGSPPYTPCDADRDWGTHMRRQWVELTRDGRLQQSPAVL